ncbi:MAG: phenylalanine--tRNA ligase subunit alpha [Dehalococcoidia bacterium]|nr:phenylalanine--tRNA ligase subunit alpha [Dehalococcoidia bacterium]
MKELDDIKQQALLGLSSLGSVDQLENWRVRYLGRKGDLTNVLRGISNLPIDDRKIVGSKANKLRIYLEEEYQVNLSKIKSGNLDIQDAIDITLPGRKVKMGRLHPSTTMIREIIQAFNEMGFQTVEGDEIELEKYNFDMLNIPADHPARDQWDTIWIDSDQHDDLLLRTHTSPMQARVMEKNDPQVRVIVPGKCYRYEATDATHEWHFNQIEGLAVDTNITFADLKGTLYEFVKKIFGPSRKVRFRCDFFPFVEPGVDMSIDWNGRWIEIMGAGMVHPKVLEAVGYDTEKYTGFAFGMGPERISMLQNEITDIRHFYSNDLRFLSQF